MKLISWNVNGIRAILKKGFLDFVSAENPDILCIQETKAHPDQVDVLLEGYPYHYWNSAEKKGYSGVAVFSKIKPLRVFHWDTELNDNEGRTLVLEFEKYFFVGVYTPNSKRGLERLDDRQRWDKEFLRCLKRLEEKKSVVCCGDLNVAHKEIDIARPQANHYSAGFTDEERSGMDAYISGGFVDTFREYNVEGENYTWWSYMGGARSRNVGWRIDYFLISACLREYLKDAFILPEVMGSDHCPVGIILKI